MTRDLEMTEEGPICPADLKPCPQDECECGDYCWALDGGLEGDIGGGCWGWLVGIIRDYP